MTKRYKWGRKKNSFNLLDFFTPCAPCKHVKFLDLSKESRGCMFYHGEGIFLGTMWSRYIAFYSNMLKNIQARCGVYRYQQWPQVITAVDIQTSGTMQMRYCFYTESINNMVILSSLHLDIILSVTTDKLLLNIM